MSTSAGFLLFLMSIIVRFYCNLLNQMIGCANNLDYCLFPAFSNLDESKIPKMLILSKMHSPKEHSDESKFQSNKFFVFVKILCDAWWYIFASFIASETHQTMNDNEQRFMMQFRLNLQ